MKKLNQKGVIEPIQILLIILILGVIGFVGYRVAQTKDEEPQAETTNTSEQSQPEAEKPKEDEPQEDIIKTLEPSVELLTAADISKLPDYTPASFVEYMTGELEKNTPDENGCVYVYGVSKVSPLNIAGGSGLVDPETGEEGKGCGGGGKIIWYLQNESWNSLGFQSLMTCPELEITSIYTEMLEECYVELNSQETAPNPNGSIYDAL